ncbi:MAG: outer membrane beta-barrel protein [Rhodothermales bacterium]
MTRVSNVSGVLAALLFVVAFGAEQSSAQTLLEIGPRIGYEVDQTESVFVGGDVRIGLMALPVIINPYFDYFFPSNEDVSLWQVGANALYTFGIDNQMFTPYAGAGLAITRQSVETAGDDITSTEPGLNLLFGAQFGSGQMRPFAQAQISIGDFDMFAIAGGLLFHLGL